MILSSPRTVGTKKPTHYLDSFLLALAGVALLLSLLFPIWRITLDAPQYPEGMGMTIWAETIKGESDHDLDIINELNHYIGMKKIVPESIPELTFILPIIVAFGILSFIVAIRPRIWSTALLLAGLAGAGVAGLFDFWEWEYDYGHNLNPAAAIKVPGMTYQPPLIGSAKLLNFLSTSWPSLGGYLMFFAGFLIALALLHLAWEKFGHKSLRVLRGRTSVSACLLLATVASGMAGCKPAEPAPVAWGEDACHYCKMTLVQKGFAAERINAKGKIFKYDAVQCLVNDLKQHPLQSNERVFVSDWSRPEAAFLPAGEAVYLKGERVPSPMGAVAAFQSKDSAEVFRVRTGGDVLAWEQLSPEL